MLEVVSALRHPAHQVYFLVSCGYFQTLAELHEQLEDILSVLNLGSAGIRYFAGSVLKSRMFQLQQRAEPARYIHTTAFVAHQFYRIQDHLTDTFLNVMASFQTTASREHKPAWRNNALTNRRP